MISHRRKFIFVHNVKTGGCSIEAAFGVGMDFHNPEQSDDERHRRLSHYKALFPDEFAGYFKFAFVRNPWDRMVSRWANKREALERKLALAEPASEELQHRIEQRSAKARTHPAFRPFQEFLADPGLLIGNQLVEHPDQIDMEPQFDFIGRFESLSADFANICERLGVRAELPHVNTSSHRHYTTYYDDAAREFVARKCAHDIERFGYRFGD